MKISRVIFRGGKGRAIPSFYNATFDDNNIILDEKEYFNTRQIFVIVMHGNILLDKIRKNLEIFNCETFIITKVSNIQKDLEYINNEIAEQKKVVDDSKKALLNIVKKKTEPIRILGRNYKCIYSLYRTFCKREKYIYMNLNRCKDLNSFYIGDVWIPQIAFGHLSQKIKELIKENEDILLPSFRESHNVRGQRSWIATSIIIFIYRNES